MKKATLSSILSIAGLLAGGVIVEAQQPTKLYRVGYLLPTGSAIEANLGSLLP